jgi:hypothetical protein
MNDMQPGYIAGSELTGGNMGMGMGANMGNLQMMANNMFSGMNSNNPSLFYVSGNALSLQSRVEALSDEALHKIVDANITVTGTQIQSMNMGAYMCTIIGGSFIILPLFFICCDWWKRCTLPAFDVPTSVYQSLIKLMRGSSLRNITLTVIDNCFDAIKASILYEGVSQSRLSGFTFVNRAGEYDFIGNECSRFVVNMMPIKRLPQVMSDIRWGS